MEFGWPLPKRRQFLKEVQEQPSDKTHPVPFQGKVQYLRVHTIPLDLPLYRLENGRTTGRQAEYLAEHPERAPDFFRADTESAPAQAEQHDILVKLTRERKNLFKEFEKNPQSEPIILNSLGYVVNGNRRLSTWRELYRSDPAKFAHFANIETVILPYADDKDIDRLEADLQLKEDLKADYSWTSTALMIREKMDRYHYDEDELASIYEKDVKGIREILDCLDYAEQYLESRDKAAHYSDVDGKEYAFLQIARARKRIKGPEPTKEVFEKAAFCLADEAGEGKRIYAEIPKIAENLDRITNGLIAELDLSGDGSPEERQERVAKAISEPEQLETARLAIRDIIEASSLEKRDVKRKNHVANSVLKAASLLKEAKGEIKKDSSKVGVLDALADIEATVSELRAWVAADGK